MYNTIHSSDGGGLAYLDVVQAAVVVTNSREMFQKPDADPVNVAVKGDTKGEKKVVPWGSSNDLPMQIISKVGKSPDMSTNMLFNNLANTMTKPCSQSKKQHPQDNRNPNHLAAINRQILE